MPASERALRGPAAAFGLAGAHALLWWAAFAPLALWPLVWLAPLPLAWLALRPGPARTALPAVLAAAFTMWLWMQRWLIDVTRAGWPLLALYLAAWTVLLVWVLRRIAGDRRLAALPMALVLPVVWVGIECLRGEFLFHGYPWFLAAHPVVELPLLAQSADLGGQYLSGFLVVMVPGALLDLLRLRLGGAASRKAACAGVVGALLLQGANVAYGLWRLGQEGPLAAGPRLVALQTNLPQSNKIAWTTEAQARDVPEFLEQTRRAVLEAGGPVDLAIWPETMLPGAGLEPETIEILKGLAPEVEPLHLWGERLVALSRDLATPILAGSIAWVEPFVQEEPDGPHWEWRYEYNSAYLIGTGLPVQRYDKHFLTPFGETMPYISRWEWLEKRLLALGAGGMEFQLSASPVIRRLRLPWSRASGESPRRDLVLATPICFEDTVARVCRRMVAPGGKKATDLLVNLSNDGWFGDHDAGRRQHLQIARFRCIENRVPMLRAVNTGLSGAIDSRGVLVALAPAREAARLAAELPLDRRSTLYGRLGEAWAWLCLAAAAAGTGWTFLKRQDASARPRGRAELGPEAQPRGQDAERLTERKSHG